MRYYKYSEYLLSLYGEKVYKLPISIPVSCPNRLGNTGGCTYCGSEGAGFENISGVFSVREQIEKNMDYIGKKYKAKKFIAYFQNFTNTYLPLSEFKKFMNEAAKCDIVEISISTRPDCIRKEYLDVLDDIKKTYGIEITIELGLQSANYHSLIKTNRGHTLGEYIESAILIKSYGFKLCTHIILNLPWDDMTDVIESAKIVSALKNDFIKLHALYIEKNTVMEKQFLNNEFEICSVSEYKERVITFLRYVSPNIAFERIIGRAPKENTVFANWGMSWWKIHDEIVLEMEEKNFSQGDLFNYLGGKGVKKFFD